MCQGRVLLPACACSTDRTAVPEGAPMRCPRCEFENLDGSNFCIECGSALRPRCPRCGLDNVTRAKFCAECGTPLTGQSSALAPAHPQPLLSYTPNHLAEKILWRPLVKAAFSRLRSVLNACANHPLQAQRGMRRDRSIWNFAWTIADGNPLGQALVLIGWKAAGDTQEGRPTPSTTRQPGVVQYWLDGMVYRWRATIGPWTTLRKDGLVWHR